MKPILFVRCDDFETFGVAPDAVTSAGGQVRVWDAIGSHPGPDLEDVGGVVLFGSSYNVEHADEQPFIKDVRELTREAADRSVPLLGVCFGAQMLAWALDAQVSRAAVREVGFEPVHPLAEAATDPLLSLYEDGDRVFQWHMDTFALPDGALLLAEGDGVTNQAFRWGARAWGVQYHFEVEAEEIELWLREFARTAELEPTWGKSADQVRAETVEYIEPHQRKGREVFRRFTELVRETSA